MSSEWVVRNVVAPTSELDGLWQSIVLEDALKDQLLNQAVLELTIREQVPFVESALHGLILLYGPPGTGKTTLVRGLPQVLAGVVKAQKVRLIEIDPHGLMSAEHGQSQQRVTQVLNETVPLLCDDGLPSIVLLDEVESMAVARSEASLAANPADIHRATDAVLMALDRNAGTCPHILTIATSNFTGTLDEAFRSRADLELEIPLPGAAAALKILRATLSAFGAHYPGLATLAANKKMDQQIGKHLEGLDARRTRKLVSEAIASRREVVLDPDSLTLADLATAAKRAQRTNQSGGS